MEREAEQVDDALLLSAISRSMSSTFSKQIGMGTRTCVWITSYQHGVYINVLTTKEDKQLSTQFVSNFVHASLDLVGFGMYGCVKQTKKILCKDIQLFEVVAKVDDNLWLPLVSEENKSKT